MRPCRPSPLQIYIVMRGKTCAWGGMGYVGCHGDCRVWIQGDLWNVRPGEGARGHVVREGRT